MWDDVRTDCVEEAASFRSAVLGSEADAGAKLEALTAGHLATQKRLRKVQETLVQTMSKTELGLVQTTCSSKKPMELEYRRSTS